MRHFQLARRAGVPTAAALIGALVATPALADVTVSPTSVPQGSGQNLTFHVTNTGARPIHTITLRMPADTPVAEVYPLSVDDWAPRIEMRKLATPLATIHGDTTATETADAITWLAMPGKDLPTGKGTDLTVAVGPLPTLSAMRFTVVTTYADGKPGPAMPPATLTLTPAAAGQAPAHGHGGATTATATRPDEAALFEATVAEADRGPSVWSIGGWVVAALALAGGAVAMLRGRHRAEPDDDEPDEDETEGTAAAEPAAAADEKEPVAAGSSKWSYRG